MAPVFKALWPVHQIAVNGFLVGGKFIVLRMESLEIEVYFRYLACFGIREG